MLDDPVHQQDKGSIMEMQGVVRRQWGPSKADDGKHVAEPASGIVAVAEQTSHYVGQGGIPWDGLA